MNTRELTSTAAKRLDGAPVGRRIVLIYAGILTGLAALTTLINFLLELQIAKTGGLGSLGVRSVLATVQTLLPVVQALIGITLALGYRASMLRIARGQYVSPQTLRLGMDRFWVLLRCTLIRGLMLLGICMVSIYAAVTIFMLTPLSGPMMEVLAPVVENMTALSSPLVLDDALYYRMLPAMAPVFVIFFILFTALAIPVAFRYRMADYVLIDKPGTGALAALGESRMMMRGNFKNLLKLDLRLWWYYAATAGAAVLCYGDQLLSAAGVQLPVSDTAAYYGFYALYLAVQFAIYYFLNNRVEVCYALAYETVRPEEKKPEGAVLGNIFRM